MSMTPAAIRYLFDYNYWADERLWACVMAISDEQFVQPLDYSTGSIRNHVVHLMSSLRRWIARIAPTPDPSFLPYGDYPTRGLAKAGWEGVQRAVLDYVRGLDQAQLDEVVRWEVASAGLSNENPRWQVLLHLTNHATDHRAQILTLLDHHFAVPTAAQDMIYYWLAEPASSSEAGHRETSE